ncbi:MAG: heme exporter protein CcmB [Candidatus Neomarinimicrobiota bacterium]|nr:heme exporter protein CcmB [Candidatus Neomarinimicrobiota bacterium]
MNLVILIRKELLLELRSREILISMITFGASVMLLYAFAFRPTPEALREFAPGLLWTVILFVGVLALHRSHSLEKEFDAFSLLLSAPVERSTLFLSKWFGSFILLVISQVILLPIFFLFLQLPFPSKIVPFIGLFILVDLGISSAGSLLSGAVMRSRVNEFLLPLLLFPMVTPLMISAVKSTAAIMESQPFSQWKLWLQLIVSFVIVFGLVGYLIYDYVSEE